MIGTALAAASGLASLYGMIKSAHANQAIDAQLQKRQSDLTNWYDKEYNTSFLDTAEGKSSLQVLRDNLNQRMKGVNQGNAIKGASDEMAVASADQGQRAMAGAVTRLAGYGTMRKNQIGQEYRSRQSSLDNAMAANLQNKSAQWSNFSNNAMNAGIGAAEADGNGAFDKWDQKLGEWFNSRKRGGTGNSAAPD